MRRASRLNDTRRPLFASNTRTPTGEGLDQRLEIRPRPLLVAVGARVGDSRGGLGGEQRQHLLVLVGEPPPARLVAEKEVADMRVPVTQRRAHEGAGRQEVDGEAERADVLRPVGEAQRPRQVAQVGGEMLAVGPLDEPAPLVLGEVGGDEVAHLTRLVDGDDDAVARGGQGAGGLDRLAQHGVVVEGGADPEHRVGQCR